MAKDKFISDKKAKKDMPVTDEVTTKLLSVAGICKNGPKDLAENHDKYLYGTGKEMVISQ